MNSPPIAWLDDELLAFPPLERALTVDSGVPGLLAAGGNLSVNCLRRAYRHGVFPWFSEGQPILWWSPDPRMVLPVPEFRLSRSLRRTIQRFRADSRCELRVDSAFRQVIDNCAATARPGQDGTWIVTQMAEAYTAWHQCGEVHSFETWIDGKLAGGLYGVGLGRMFYGESMFSHRTDASKIALAALIAFCRRHGIALIDCQQRTEHLASLGAREIPRADFMEHVRGALARPPVDRWTFDPSMWEELLLPRNEAGAGLALGLSSAPGLSELESAGAPLPSHQPRNPG